MMGLLLLYIAIGTIVLLHIIGLGFDKRARKLARLLIKHKGNGFCMADPFLDIRQKFLYQVKLWIVIIFGLKVKQDWKREDIPVFIYNYRQDRWEGTYSWSEVSVGKGLWKNWWYTEYVNGT
jgi:hypothetical protein